MPQLFQASAIVCHCSTHFKVKIQLVHYCMGYGSRAPQNYFLPLSHFFYLKSSVKVRKFLLDEFATKRAKSYCFLQNWLCFTHFFIGEKSTMSLFIRFPSTCFCDRTFFLWQKRLSVEDNFFFDQNFLYVTEVCLSDGNSDRNLFLW